MRMLLFYILFLAAMLLLGATQENWRYVAGSGLGCYIVAIFFVELVPNSFLSSVMFMTSLLSAFVLPFIFAWKMR